METDYTLYCTFSTAVGWRTRWHHGIAIPKVEVITMGGTKYLRIPAFLVKKGKKTVNPNGKFINPARVAIQWVRNKPRNHLVTKEVKNIGQKKSVACV